MIHDWLNSPDMQETIRLILTPHFLFFLSVSICFSIVVYNMGKTKSAAEHRLSEDEKGEFRAMYAKRKDRARMPTKLDEYASEHDKRVRKIYLWAAFQAIATLLLFYKLLELYAL